MSKQFRSHAEQIALLRERGMEITSDVDARYLLERINYYRLSGYWYSWRVMGECGKREDSFVAGTKLTDVVAIYEFDRMLREAIFAALTPIELSLRAMLGHELGRIDPLVHMKRELLGPVALQGSDEQFSSQYQKWLKRYQKELSASREDFVAHHKQKYGGQLPIWAAVEVMDWGSLTYLYRLSPVNVREKIAVRVGLNGAQFGSWLKALNILRNYSAHHARMFNRVYAIKPRLPKAGQCVELDSVAGVTNRLFGRWGMFKSV